MPGAELIGHTALRSTDHSLGTEILAFPYVYVFQPAGTESEWSVVEVAEVLVEEYAPSTLEAITSQITVVPIRFTLTPVAELVPEQTHPFF